MVFIQKRCAVVSNSCDSKNIRGTTMRVYMTRMPEIANIHTRVHIHTHVQIKLYICIIQHSIGGFETDQLNLPRNKHFLSSPKKKQKRDQLPRRQRNKQT